MIGIYAIRNTQNGKMYIGESIDIEQRWKVHQEDLDNGNHHSYKLQMNGTEINIISFDFSFLKNLYFHLTLNSMKQSFSLSFIAENTII